MDPLKVKEYRDKVEAQAEKSRLEWQELKRRHQQQDEERMSKLRARSIAMLERPLAKEAADLEAYAKRMQAQAQELEKAKARAEQERREREQVELEMKRKEEELVRSLCFTVYSLTVTEI